MESIFSFVIIFTAILFYISNRGNVINRWCALYLGFASIGVVKEAFMYQLIPFIQSVWGDVIREEVYIGIYSVMTWVSYSFAVPAAFIMGLYFYGLNNTNPKLLTIIKAAICLPALVLSFIYPPISFREFQLNDQVFWIVYSVYNLGFGSAVIGLIIKGVRIEKSRAVRKQKILLGAVILPATIYALVTTFVIHTLGLERWFKAWQWNIFIIILSALLAFVMSFKSGFLGLKLTAQKYNWDSDMDLVNRAADYTSHMLKNQTSKMELCIKQLESQYEKESAPEELAILSRSISTLKNYVDRMKRHSQTIHLLEETCSITELITNGAPVFLKENTNITLRVGIAANTFLLCDKVHMTEVLSNIITNAAEAIRKSGTIEITGEYDKSRYLLQVKDNGVGFDKDVSQKLFTPYFTTKNTEKNFGLGLAYCKNVIERHGGKIRIERRREEETVVTISFPIKRISTKVEEGGAS